jgi:hypothetical protein
MATSLAELLKLVPTLVAEDSGYSFAASGTTISGTYQGDDEPAIVVELDEKAHTFRFVDQKPSSRVRTFEAGGIYNTAKRAGLFDHRPQKRVLKETISGFLTKHEWTRTR